MTSHADEKTAVKDGEIVLLDHELWSDASGRTELVDTTKEEVARDAKIPLPEGVTFGARAHLVGGDEFPSAIEKAILGAKVGDEFERDFSPSEAFGERDPKLIELFSMHEVSRLPEMRRDDAELEVGTVLTIGGRRGRVVSLTAARVRVDFNPPLAGRKIHGKFHILGRVVAPAEQAKALIELGYGRSKEFEVKVEDGVVTIHVPERSKFDYGWMAAKPRVIDRIRTHLKPHSIRVVEEYLTPTPAKDRSADKSKGSESPEAGTSKAAPHHHAAGAEKPKDEEAADKAAPKSATHPHPAKAEKPKADSE